METVLGVCLLSLVIMAVLSLLPAASAAGRRAAQELEARSLAQSLLEDQRAAPFRSLEMGRKDLDPATVDGVVYRPTLEISAVDGEDAGRIKDVRVTVRWSYRGQEHSVAQETYVAQIPR